MHWSNNREIWLKPPLCSAPVSDWVSDWVSARASERTKYDIKLVMVYLSVVERTVWTWRSLLVASPKRWTTLWLRQVWDDNDSTVVMSLLSSWEPWLEVHQDNYWSISTSFLSVGFITLVLHDKPANIAYLFAWLLTISLLLPASRTH